MINQPQKFGNFSLFICLSLLWQENVAQLEKMWYMKVLYYQKSSEKTNVESMTGENENQRKTKLSKNLSANLQN